MLVHNWDEERTARRLHILPGRKIKLKLGKVFALVSWPAAKLHGSQVRVGLTLLISFGASGNTPEPYFAFSWAKMAA